MRYEDQAFFNSEGFKRSLAAYENMLKENCVEYFEAEELTDIAEYYMVNGREAEATETIQFALQLHPRSVDPEVFLARQHMFKNNIEEAHRICDNIIDQTDREVFFLNAELLMHEGKEPEAMDMMWERFMQMDEDKARFLHDCINICHDYDLHDKALEWSNALYNDFPNYKERSFILGESLAHTGNTKDAIPLLEQEIERSPYNTDAWSLLAESHFYEKEIEEAIDALDFLLAIDDNNTQAKLNKANCLIVSMKNEDALLCLDEILADSPNENDAIYMRIICLVNLNRYFEAISAIKEQTMKAENDELISLYAPYLALCYLNTQQLDKYLEILPVSVELNERDTQLLLGQLFPDDMPPSLYYKYAYKEIYGKEPE